MKFESILTLKNCDDGGLRKKNILKKTNENNPLITIITATYNSENYLNECLTSLYKQNYENYEHLVIDGGSTDSTIDILKRNEDKIDYWCSQKDAGIYDAFNKGMQLANGDYICFLNSDDTFTDNALQIYLRYIKRYPEKDFIFGSVRKHWGVLYGYKPYKIFWSWGFYSSHSTGFLIKKNSAKKVGFYNLDFKYSSDYDYFYRMIVNQKLKGIGTKKDEIVGNFRRGGYSSSITFIDHFFEEIKIRIKNNQNKFLILIIFIYKYLKNFNKF